MSKNKGKFLKVATKRDEKEALQIANTLKEEFCLTYDEKKNLPKTFGEKSKMPELFVVAGELGPDCMVTNMALATLCPKEKKKIIITQLPQGSGIPIEIRNGWIGVVISGTRGPFSTGTKSIVNGELKATKFTEGYAVDTLVALKSLKRVNSRSWKWFRSRKLPKHLFFNKECCKVVSKPKGKLL
ncbi:MAG: hypothetical protein A3H02_00305 [Candidatus Niyogibacteria bacterium RIFCSPLOWO2_12_FULL_41_13]|uniref:Uncharacterized protein n=1 Tax=Candidatus Niyogibacteria bacterium RIFCSPLOWO2_12_FULL_41_13 TaxID=1801726 RepID=A0A1G2F3G5_9BACT|nr:MAG: hypothetical protein A3H02_00305 [Candidatus Niyogibacteria bacterium RIFCSPLOWO2_12_FULL_41_13]